MSGEGLAAQVLWMTPALGQPIEQCVLSLTFYHQPPSLLVKVRPKLLLEQAVGDNTAELNL